MPLIEGYISELTDDLAARLEQAITSAVREAVAQAFPPALGFEPGTPEYQVGLEIAPGSRRAGSGFPSPHGTGGQRAHRSGLDQRRSLP